MEKSREHTARVLDRVDRFLDDEQRSFDSSTADDLAAHAVAAANYVIALGRLSAKARGPDRKGVLRRSAPTLGLIVRSTKLYEGMIQQVCAHHGELAQALFRPLLEAVVTAEYLMSSTASIATEFIETSYRAEMRQIEHLEQIGRTRELLPIEQRMIRSARAHLRRDSVSHAKLKRRKNWKLDGRSMSDLMSHLAKTGPGWENAYVFGYMPGSHWAHGTWYDLIVNHLQKRGRQYHAKASFSVPTVAHITPASLLLLRALDSFERRHQVRESNQLRKRIQRLESFFSDLDAAYEIIRQNQS